MKLSCMNYILQLTKAINDNMQGIVKEDLR